MKDHYGHEAGGWLSTCRGCNDFQPTGKTTAEERDELALLLANAQRARYGIFPPLTKVTQVRLSALEDADVIINAGYRRVTDAFLSPGVSNVQ